MLRHRLAVTLVAALCAVSGPALAGDLTVTFKFDGSSKCSRVSPQITVGNIPAGTVAFKVKLRDLDVVWRHGGGTVPNDGSGVIKKGALKEGYNGPCPPSGSHTYEFTVKALDGNDDVLAEGAARQRFP